MKLHFSEDQVFPGRAFLGIKCAPVSPFPLIRATCSGKGCFGDAGSDLANSNWYWDQSDSAQPRRGFGTD